MAHIEHIPHGRVAAPMPGQDDIAPLQRKRPMHTRPRLRAGALAMSLAAATLLSGVLQTKALAEENAKIKEMTFDVSELPLFSTIRVASSDGKKWDTILPAQVGFEARMKIDTKYPGVVERVGIFLGHCNHPQCGNGFPLVFFDAPNVRDYIHSKSVTFSTAKIPVSSPTGIAAVPYGDQILKKCNDGLTADGATLEQSFQMTMWASLSVNTQKATSLGNDPNEVWEEFPDYSGGDQTRHGTFHMSVTCLATSKTVANPNPHRTKVTATSIDLFRTTYSHATSQPNPGTVCKKARWLVRLNTDKAGPVKFKLWLKNGDAPMTSKVINAVSQADGAGKFKAEYAEWTEVSKTSVVQGMAEDMTNPIGQSTGWKKITQHCTGAGGGGLAGTPGNSNPDNGTLPDTLKVTGELTLADSAPNSDKPRLGQAVFKIWASKSGPTSYKLTCSGGRNWEGTLPTNKVADHKYQAVGAQNFQVSKTEQIGCALRSTSLPKKDVIAVASKLFVIKSRHPDVGSTDKTPDRKPQTGSASHDRPATLVAPKRPAKFGIIIQPVYKVACAGGRVSGQSCICPPRTERVQAGAHAYRCVKRTAQPKRLAPSAAHRPAPAFTHKLRPALRRSAGTGR